MSADCKIQFNYKNDAGDLINVYAQSEQEAIDLHLALSNPVLLASIIDAKAELAQVAGVSVVKAAFPGAQVQAQATFDSPSCNHGQRVRKEGRSAKGPWGAWFCSQTSGNKCDPIWDEK